MENVKNSEITVLKETQDALRASELRYRRLFESAKDGILILHAETGKIVDVNPFLVDLLGYSHNQFIDKFIWDIGIFKDIIANQDNFIQLKEEKYIRYEDLPLETADGRKIDVEFVSNVYQENHNAVIQCNIRDITARKHAADIIATERERLAVTLRCIGDGVIATDTKGNIEIMNGVAEELCGWRQDEVRGKPLISAFNIINENTRFPRENPVEKVLATGKIIEPANNTLIIAKDGTERIIADSAAPIRDRNNSIIGVVLVFRDITERQKLIETAQRNHKLESLGLLAGGIAHDFNNLMGGIFGFIDLALGQAKTPKVIDYLTIAMRTIDRARGLTRQLLTFSKGGAPVKKSTPIIHIIRETTQFALSGTNVSCRYEIADDLWICNIDKAQICQVIDNIVINAQQAMPCGGIIEVSATNISIDVNEHQLLAPGNYVKVSIKDTGIGISKKILPRIFDPFFTTKTKGHGLGLSMCYSIINRHSGTIDIDSAHGEGSTFHIYLPAATHEPDVSFAAPTEKIHKGSGRIIVMDDEEVIRETIGTMLEDFGYTVECKKEGEEALVYFIEETEAKRPIKALILDLTIPGGMGGKGVVKEIRKLNAHIPVFVASGYADDPIMKNPSEYGFMASICKPFKKAELGEMLEMHLK
jgi:PAS domain S-box-containing protein